MEFLCYKLANAKSLESKRKTAGGRPAVPLHIKILIFLWYTASGEPLRSISDRFNVVNSSALKIIHQVTDAINEKLLPEVVTWPKDVGQLKS